MTILSNNITNLISLLPPPPPYNDFDNFINNLSNSFKPTFLNLPDHLILEILAYLTLHELTFIIRIVNKKFLIFSKNLLRLQLLPSYISKVKNNYSSDPLGLTSTATSSTIQQHFNQQDAEDQIMANRESKVLDLYTISVSQKMLLESESTLHLSIEHSASESAERDLFGLLQPRARIEDLVIGIAKGIGLIRNQAVVDSKVSGEIIREQDILVELTGKTAKLLLPFESSSGRGRVVNKGLVEVRRSEEESLEVVAERLVDGLSRMRLSREGNSSSTWYRKM